LDKATQDVEHVLRLASPPPDDKAYPGPGFDIDASYITLAIQGIVGMLKAASQSASVKRVVITASVAILGTQEGKDTVGADDLRPAQ
jgi:nucleoside-diphosphate-sugar epimerase